MSTPLIGRHDVVVIGSRCAGAATAMLLARAGHDVAVVDRARFPSDVLSTHSIARGGVVQLARWGLLDDVLASGAPPVREVRFVLPDGEVTRRVKDRDGVDMLVAPRRYALDSLLVDAAAHAGVKAYSGTTVTGVRRDSSGRVAGVVASTSQGKRLELASTYVVGADGLRSRMAGWLGAQVLESFEADVATLYMYVADAPWTGHELHVGDRAFAGEFLTHHGEGCVWLCRPTRALAALHAAGDRAAALVAELAAVAPALAARVREGRVTSPVRGVARLPNHLRQPTGPGWALVGDAGYHRDPVTGHGITDAFRDADLLATALHAALRDPSAEPAALAGYRTQRDAMLRATFDLTRAVTSFPPPDRFVELQRQLSEALDREADDLASLPAPIGTAAAAA